MGEPRPGQPDGQDRTRQRGRRELAVVLLLLAGAVVAVSVYALVSGSEGGAPDGRDGDGKTSGVDTPTLDDVERAAEELRAVLEEDLAAAADAADNPEPVAQGLRQKLLEEARDRTRRAVKAFPADVILRPVLIRALLALGQVEEAEEVLAELRLRVPNKPETLYLAAEVAKRRGRPHVELLRRAARSEVPPRAGVDAEIWGAYGLALLAEGRGGEARQYLRGAVLARHNAPGELGRRDLPLLTALGRMEYEAEQYAEAGVLLGDAAKLAPQDYEIATLLIESKLRAGELDAAEEALTRAQATFGKWMRLMELKAMEGRLRQQQERWAEAAEAFVQASANPPLKARASLHAAVSYHKAGESALAREQIRIAAELRPNDPDVRAWRREIEAAP